MLTLTKTLLKRRIKRRLRSFRNFGLAKTFSASSAC